MLDRVGAVLAEFDELTPGDSAFGDGPAWWFGTKEVAHVDSPPGADPLVVDLRVTRKSISAHRSMLKEACSVGLRSGTSDWLALTVSSPESLDLLRTMAGWIVTAHRDLGLDPAVAPPTGGALARRRRFH